MDIQLIWACDPSLQLEHEWLVSLLNPHVISQHILDASEKQFAFSPSLFPVIIESGLIRLRSDVTQSELEFHDNLRKTRYSSIPFSQPFCVIHLSDEEGFDADMLYSSLANHNCVIWRNFMHPRLLQLPTKVYTFPIGPRASFLPLLNSKSYASIRDRIYPWAFMGTIWPGGSRFESVSRFLVDHPSGFHFASKSFGCGLPLDTYKDILKSSIFSLAPEGDRHLDTFRLWESLSCGCIPLLVDYQNCASTLLPPDYPLPIFPSWKAASSFVTNSLSHLQSLSELQRLCFVSWFNYYSSLRLKFQSSLIDCTM